MMSQSPRGPDCPFPGAEQPGSDAQLMLLDDRQWSFLRHRYDLTPREQQIAELVCQGFRTGNIASRLSIRPGTVKTHVRNIYRKVRVKNKINMLLRFVAETREPANGHEGPRPSQ
jgi:DNA-binding NarL/FixJ family response regulator